MRLSVREPLPYWVIIDYQHTTFLTSVGQGGISLVKNLVGRIRVKEILIFLLDLYKPEAKASKKISSTVSFFHNYLARVAYNGNLISCLILSSL